MFSCSLCVCTCEWKSRQCVCQSSVTITDCRPIAALLRRLSWHWLHWPCSVCVRVRSTVYLYGCMNVCRGLVKSAMTLPTACVPTRGDLFLCVCAWECVCICVPCCRQGKSLSSLCWGVGGDTSFICAWVSLCHCGSFPSDWEGLMFYISLITLF